MTAEEREIEILHEKVRHLKLAHEKIFKHLSSTVDALIEIAMALGIPEDQVRAVRNMTLVKGVILHKILQLQSRVPKSKHTDKRKAGDLQHLNLPGQKEMEFNGPA